MEQAYDKYRKLQMEYVKGTSIDNYFLSIFDTNYKELENIFKQTILAFEYLEKNQILQCN